MGRSTPDSRSTLLRTPTRLIGSTVSPSGDVLVHTTTNAVPAAAHGTHPTENRIAELL
jgi:hypothetical protein